MAILGSLSGCQSGTNSTPATEAEVDTLKLRMNDAFSALEMYASDHSLAYPKDLKNVMPKYLESVPLDPVSRKDIVYKKTEEGFLLEASGDYSAVKAEKGFPKMNQDGFYVKKAEDFPKEE